MRPFVIPSLRIAVCAILGMDGPIVAPFGNKRGVADPNDAGVGCEYPCAGTGVGCEYPHIVVWQEEEALRRDHFLFQEPDSTLLISGTAGSLQVGTGVAGMRLSGGRPLRFVSRCVSTLRIWQPFGLRVPYL